MNKNVQTFPSILVVSIRGTKYKQENNTEAKQEMAQFGYVLVSKNEEGNPHISSQGCIDLKTTIELSGSDKDRIGLAKNGLPNKGPQELYDFLQKEFNIKEIPWASWGDFERKIISQTHVKTRTYPFNGRHLNLKTIYGILRTGFTEIQFHKVMKELRLRKEFDSKVNNAGGDAFLTAQILMAVMKSIEVDNGRDYREEE